MAKRNNRKIVVDASVARSAGASKDQFSINCREVLDTLLRSRHLMTMSPVLYQEWNLHAGHIAQEWLGSMQSRGLIYFLQECTCREIRAACNMCAMSDKNKVAWKKDFHLICAAHVTDKAIISLDDEARDIFAMIADSSSEVSSIEWMNPYSEFSVIAAWVNRVNKQKRDFSFSSKVV